LPPLFFFSASPQGGDERPALERSRAIKPDSSEDEDGEDLLETVCEDKSKKARAFAFTIQQGKVEKVYDADGVALETACLQWDVDARAIIEIIDKTSVRYAFQFEQGARDGRFHVQGAVQFKTPVTVACVKRKLQMACPGTNPFVTIMSSQDGTRGFTYCIKEETRILPATAHLLRIRDDNSGPFYKNVTLPVVELKPEYTYEQMLPWQKDTYNWLMGPPSDREVRWIIGEKGGEGKSAFMRDMCIRGGFVFACGKNADIACAIVRHIKGDPKNKIPPQQLKGVIIDVPRAATTGGVHAVSYGALEHLKNGIIFSGKYESGMLAFPRIHVLVLANCHPDVSQLSADRWKDSILEIKEDKTLSVYKKIAPVFKTMVQKTRDEFDA